jgi:hypothetical protein
MTEVAEAISPEGMFYHVDIDRYHGHTFDPLPSVSSSSLKKMIGKRSCPAKFWEMSALNPNRVPVKETPALRFGRAVHALALGEPEFAKDFVVCPYDDLRSGDGYKWNKEWKAKVEAGTETRKLIRAPEFAMIEQMTKALKRSPQVAGAFTAGTPEVSFFHTDAETGVVLKVRVDWWPEDPVAHPVQEFKSALSIDPTELSFDVFDLGYHMQSALQVDVIKAVTGLDVSVAHIVQEKEPPYLAELRMFTPEQLEHGRRRYRRALHLFAECWNRHEAGAPERVAWPGYTAEPQYFETPFRIMKEMENENGDSSSDEAADNDDADPARNLRAG